MAFASTTQQNTQKYTFIFYTLIIFISLFCIKINVEASPGIEKKLTENTAIENINTTQLDKKVSLKSMTFLSEYDYHLNAYLSDNEVYDLVEECMDAILHSNEKTYKKLYYDDIDKRRLETAIAIIEAKYFQYYYLDYCWECCNNHTIKINIKNARKTYYKNKEISDRIDDILFNELGINEDTTEYEAVFKINDWLHNNVEYDSTLKACTVQQLILTGKAICCSYAETFKVMCDRLGIEAHCVISWKMDHQWNTVVVNEIEYHIDTCWNDCGYYDTFFLLSEAEMLKTHLKPEWTDIKRVKIPNYYKIDYKLNGGHNNSKNTGIIIEGKNVKLYAPSKKGYVFLGWYSDSSYKNKVKNINADSNYKLYAKWEKINKVKKKDNNMPVQ